MLYSNLPARKVNGLVKGCNMTYRSENWWVFCHTYVCVYHAQSQDPAIGRYKVSESHQALHQQHAMPIFSSAFCQSPLFPVHLTVWAAALST
jgi:hypothetical protein